MGASRTCSAEELCAAGYAASDVGWKEVKEAGIELPSIGGRWKIVDNGQCFTYSWVHAAGADSFTGEQEGAGPISDATLDLSTSVIAWTVTGHGSSVKCRGILDATSRPYKITDGEYWNSKSGKALGKFTGRMT